MTRRLTLDLQAHPILERAHVILDADRDTATVWVEQQDGTIERRELEDVRAWVLFGAGLGAIWTLGQLLDAPD